MDVTVSRANGSIVFELRPATGFVTFMISSSDEQVQWELEPLSVESPEHERESGSEQQPILGSKMVVVPVDASVMNALKTLVHFDEPEYPAVSRIVYGQVPSGYRELAPAASLNRGETYAVLVLGRGLDSGGVRFGA